jgi:predicted nucleotidyltransferase
MNPDHMLAPMLSGMFRREGEVRGTLEAGIAEVLSSLRGTEAAYLFGSAARGDMRPDSDIDLAIETAGDAPEDIPGLDALAGRFGNHINVIRLRRRGARGLRAAIEREGRPLHLTPRRRTRP